MANGQTTRVRWLVTQCGAEGSCSGVEVPEKICMCFPPNIVNGQIMTSIHEKLTCKHYQEIRKLIVASPEKEKALFNKAERHMRIQEVDAINNATMGDENTSFWSMLPADQVKYREYFEIGVGEVTPTTTKKVPKFTFVIREENPHIITNIEKDANGLCGLRVNNNDSDFIRLTNPYQATIHELWHNIDCLAGGVEMLGNRRVRIPLSSLLFFQKLRDSFILDFNTRCNNIHNGNFDLFYARVKALRDRYDAINLYYLFDIIEGISHCYYHNNDLNRRFESKYASRPQYWTVNGSGNDSIHLAANILNARSSNAGSSGENITDGQIKLATEFFAAVGCIASVGDEKALGLVKQYFPNAYDAYNIIVESAIERIPE